MLLHNLRPFEIMLLYVTWKGQNPTGTTQNFADFLSAADTFLEGNSVPAIQIRALTLHK
jgi:hypothetical protein